MRRSVMALRSLVAAGMLVDAYIHFDLAAQYDPIRSDSISQGDLFRIEARAALVAAVLVTALRRLVSDLFAFAVAAGGWSRCCSTATSTWGPSGRSRRCTSRSGTPTRRSASSPKR